MFSTDDVAASSQCMQPLLRLNGEMVRSSSKSTCTNGCKGIKITVVMKYMFTWERHTGASEMRYNRVNIVHKVIFVCQTHD